MKHIVYVSCIKMQNFYVKKKIPTFPCSMMGPQRQAAG